MSGKRLAAPDSGASSREVGRVGRPHDRARTAPWTDFGIGVGILVGSVLLYIFRRVVQDRQPVHLREETPKMPGEEVAPGAVPAT